ncbi:DUF1700 domain-containing protein [Ruminococcus sp. Marseille-P6503]|uniref:DUF1700 domain-containing protein n=1 Tax=Ruminococcus sp. Marseille-P6503 TaxID=2364796 RepID=UPI000F538B5C|nr:DUF1700 domain-containing protein [Ruminococcus sp. Marseille-P6503]
MKREEFLEQLKKRLSRLPDDELENVLDYYNEIFLDAGTENEEQTAKNLGSIDDIARQIYADNNIAPDGNPEFIMEEVVDKRHSEAEPPSEKEKGMSFGGKLLLIILLFPIWLPLIAVISAVLFSVAVTFIALGFSLGIAGAALTAVGVFTIFTAPPIGMVTAGTGLVLLSLGTIIAKPLFKRVWSGLVSLLNWLTGKAHGFLADRGAV